MLGLSQRFRNPSSIGVWGAFESQKYLEPFLYVKTDDQMKLVSSSELGRVG